MIIGIGHDVTELARVDEIVRGDLGERFLSKVLTVAERDYAVRKFGELGLLVADSGVTRAAEGFNAWRWVEFTAGRFAAKEAIVKALGCGIGAQVGFHDMEILPTPSGKPICTLSPGAYQRLGLAEDTRIHLSITHTQQIASAVAVVETT